jgi:hypothetical protein
MAYAYGGAWFDLKAHDTGKPTTFLTEPNAVVDGLQYVADLANKQRLRPNNDDAKRVGVSAASGMFQAGKLAMESLSSSTFAKLSEAGGPQWGVAAVPNPPSLPRRNWITADPWWGFKLPKFGDEQWELLKFIASKESMKLFPLQTTFAPPRQSLAADYRDYYVKLGKLNADDINRTLEALPTAFVATSQAVPLFTDAYTQVILPEMNKVLSGEITARQWVEKVRPGVEAMLKAQG